MNSYFFQITANSRHELCFILEEVSQTGYSLQPKVHQKKLIY